MLRFVARRLSASLSQLPPRLTRFDPLWPPTPGAVFALANLGDVTAEPVQTRLGWSVLKLTGERPENKRTLPEVEKKIRERL